MMNSSITMPHVQVRGNDQYRIEVKTRAEVMLKNALYEAGIDSGNFLFDISAMCASLNGFGHPYMHAEPSSLVPDGIYVKLKTCGKPDSAVAGMLHIPQGMDKAKLVKELSPVLTNHNNDQWKEVLAEIPPNPASVHNGSGDVSHGGVLRQVKLPSPVVEIAFRPREKAVTPSVQKEPPQASPVAKDEVPIKFLIEMIKGKENGVFSGKGVGAIAQKFFPNKTGKALSTGLLNGLCGLRYICRVGGGIYQVEQSFLKKHDIDIPGFTQLPRLGRGDVAVKAPTLPTEKKAMLPSQNAIDIKELIKQREEIYRQISLARQVLEEEILTATQEVTNEEASLLAAKQRLEDKKLALVRFDEELKFVPAKSSS